MEEMGSEDKTDGAEAKDGSRDGTDSQTTQKDVDGTAEEAASGMGSSSAPPCKTPLIFCADGLDQDTFKICKELFRPFKKSLRQLRLPQHLLRKKKQKYLVGSLSIIGGRVDLFVRKYCRASEVQNWQQILWQFVSLFSEMDAEELQKLYEHIKSNQMDTVLELRFPSENSDSVPEFKEKKLEQLYANWSRSRGTSDPQKHLGFQTTSEVIEKTEINQ